MSVIFGASFHDVVCLDMDNISPQSWRIGMMHRGAERIGNRFRLGDCLIVLSSYQDDAMGFHLIYDRLLHWRKVHVIITTLADEGIVDPRLKRLQISRGNFTVRMTKKIPGTFVPFPLAYVRGYRAGGRIIDRLDGGIRKWLEAWKIAINVSPDMSLSPLLAPRSRSGPRGAS